MSLRFLIIDDEEPSRAYIQDLINELMGESVIVASVNSTVRARQVLIDHDVDVILVDVHMPHETGLEFIQTLPNKELYKIVFITAYSEYAIQAVKEAAFDYILKPIDKEEFGEMLRRLSLEPGRKELTTGGTTYEKASISLHHNAGFRLILIKDIVYLKASSNYTHIRLSDGTSITVSKPLKEFELKLNRSWFFRVHKSYLINLHYMDGYLSEGGGKVLLKNGEEVYISKYKLHEFFEAISRLTNGLKA